MEPVRLRRSYYSNVSRGKRKMRNEDELIPSIMDREEPSMAHKRNWARLIQKIYEVDPLTCAKCRGRMRIIAFIEEPEIVKKILKHLGLWDQNPPYLRRVKARPPPKVNSPPMNPEYHIDSTDSQLPVSDNYLYVDAVYPQIYSS